MSRVSLISSVAAMLLFTGSCARTTSPRTAPDRPPTGGPTSTLVPLPVQVEARPGSFTLTPQTVIVAGGELERLGRHLSAFIGLGAGPDVLRVESSVGAPEGGAIILTATGRGETGHYTLEVSEKEIRIQGADAAGVFYGMQTLRQLLPARFEYEALRPPEKEDPPVRIPAVTITDGPRFEWRGAMLDVSRHFLTVAEVKRYIDLLALHKMNRLHLHLSDDQGWRLDIKSWPRLATHGGSTEVGGGEGGYYTQEQYGDIVRYAADRFVTIVPEIDMPGHTNAALASYAELNCDGVAPALYTGIEVGFSTLCVDKDITYKFIDDVVREIAALTPGPYFHVGGDEVEKLTPEQYARFIERVQTIVRSHGKQMIGWDDIAPARLEPGTIIQHWRPKTSPGEVASRGLKMIVSIADRAYVDMKYDRDTPIGLAWAATISVRASYDWNPATVSEGVPESAVLGVEAPLWTETVANINDAEFLAYPRLAAIAELGWTAQASREWNGFRSRLGAQAPRWIALGVNFFRSPEIPWQ